MTSVVILDGNGAPISPTPDINLALGRRAAALVRSFVLADEDFAVLDAIKTAVESIDGSTDGLEGLATALNGYVDGLEGLLNLFPATLGRKAEGSALGVVLSDEDLAKLDAILTALGDNATELGNINTTLGTPSTDIPHFALDATLDITQAAIAFNSTSDQDIVTATASQTTRVHRLRLSFGGACTFSVYSGGSGGTLLEAIDIPAAGIYVLDFDPRPYFITATNEKLTLKTSAAVQVRGTLGYKKSA